MFMGIMVYLRCFLGLSEPASESFVSTLDNIEQTATSLNL